MTFIDLFVTGAIYLTGFVILSIICYLLYYYTTYDYLVYLRKVVNGRTIIYIGKGKVNKDDETSFKMTGGKFIKGLLCTSPNDECIEITKNGKKIVHGWVVENNHVIWGRDEKTLQWETDESGNVKAISGLNILEPFTQNQRAMLIRQQIKAQSRKGFSWSEHVPMIAGLMFVVILFTISIVYWEDITAPSVQVLNTANSVLEKLEPLLAHIQELDSEQQTIGEKPTGVTTTTLTPLKEAGK